MNIDYPDFSAGNHNCADVDPETFFPHRGFLYKEAKETCEDCPILTACFSHAIGHDTQGFWAGTTELQRKKIRKVLRLTAISMEASIASLLQDALPATGSRPSYRENQAKAWEGVDLDVVLATRSQVLAESVANQAEALKRSAKYLRANRPTRSLTPDQVREIRTSTATNRVLGDRFDVSTAVVGKVRRGQSYVDVPA